MKKYISTMTACEKIQYGTIKEAKEAAAAIGKIRKQHMRVYKCNECRYYHLTTIKPHQRKVVKGKHRVDYTNIKPLERNKEPKKHSHTRKKTDAASNLPAV